MTEDDQSLMLSAHALAALAEFNAERDAHQSKFDELKAQADKDAQFSMEAFAEDWNKSQFWYSDETAELLADQLLSASGNSSIGVISTPSVFVALRNKLRDLPLDRQPKVVLLEHDDRFAVFPEFVYYDYQQPLKLPGNMKGSLDSVICDPPFLNEDCQTKAALTVRWLLKSDPCPSTLPRVIVCTGERMKHIVAKLYRSLKVQTTNFEPKHASGLSNEFYCYANFESSAWTWKS
ncbi:probable NADH2 dehydrogenase (ubiquinone) 40K chain [Claviceps purpurea 20.1]|uniref:Protein-lysine N-methyltransferase EFM5 n=1 Tax=Claviceps purpurea (strain 20.1) TaxID=1111077 RepID=M1VUD4_CLAP2|nr:probable NADH2 dehydrogenase (ubiquinone) 40K chain [Claviceps purpurea 20.1]